MTDIVKVDILRFAIEAECGLDITDAQAIAILGRLNSGSSGSTIFLAKTDSNFDANRYAVARQTGLITDADQEDIDAELTQRKGKPM